MKKYLFVISGFFLLFVMSVSYLHSVAHDKNQALMDANLEALTAIEGYDGKWYECRSPFTRDCMEVQLDDGSRPVVPGTPYRLN